MKHDNNIDRVNQLKKYTSEIVELSKISENLTFYVTKEQVDELVRLLEDEKEDYNEQRRVYISN